LIEAGLAISFIALASSRPLMEALVDGAVVALFVLIAVIDLEHRLILHVVSLPAAAAMAAIGILDPSRGAGKTLVGGLVGAGVVGVMYLGGIVFSRALARIRGRRLEEVVFGFGDVTLAALIGLTVGWPGIILALLLGVFAAGAYALVYLVESLLRRRYVAFKAIPYGPFLILGALAVYLGWVTSLAQAGGGG
jgi:leader peptidase (prepilin peptidase)/N-methyltransferase